MTSPQQWRPGPPQPSGQHPRHQPYGGQQPSGWGGPQGRPPQGPPRFGHFDNEPRGYARPYAPEQYSGPHQPQQYSQPYTPPPQYAPLPAPVQPIVQSVSVQVGGGPYRSVTKERRSTSHTFHLIMSICTGGVWALCVWLPITIWHAMGPRRRTVTHHY